MISNIKKYKYIFKGRVYPNRVNFSLSGLKTRYPEIITTSVDWGVSGLFSLVVKKNNITATFDTDQLLNEKSSPNIETVKNILEGTIRSFVDAFCFVNSYNYDIDVKSVSCRKINFSYTFPVIGERNIKVESRQFIKILDVMLNQGDIALPLCLADFRRSVKYPNETAKYCLRSLESIRRIHFDDPSKFGKEKDKDGWNKMSKSLDITSNNSFEEMRNIAENNRHGVYPLITFEQRQMFMNFTRIVIVKFIKWLENQKIT